MFDALEDRLERITHILFQLFGVDCCKWIVHPAVVPFLPVGSCKPHIFKRLEVFDQTAKLIVLLRVTEMCRLVARTGDDSRACGGFVRVFKLLKPIPLFPKRNII